MSSKPADSKACPPGSRGPHRVALRLIEDLGVSPSHASGITPSHLRLSYLRKWIMNIPKQLIIDRLRERKLDARADWVDRTLPDEVDPYEHSGLLATLNIKVEDLIGDNRP
jgi:hypothetical protein